MISGKKTGRRPVPEPVGHPLWDAFTLWIVSTGQTFQLPRNKRQAFECFCFAHNLGATGAKKDAT